jgi:hypothetical protein
VSGQRTPRPYFTPGKDPAPIVQEAGWAPGPVWTGAENIALTGIGYPELPARSQSLYRLSCSAHLLNLRQNKFERAVIFSDSKAAILSAGSTETVISTEARDCQVPIRHLKAKHEQIVLQWIPGHCQIAGNEHADALDKKGAKITQKHIRETSYHYWTTLTAAVPKCIQTWTRDKVIPKIMEARNSQNTRLAKKKGSCRISIVGWAWLLGYTSSPHWNPPRTLMHAMQLLRTHGQKPSRTMYRPA